MKKMLTLTILIAGILIASILNFNNIKETFYLNTKNLSVDSKQINKDNKYIKAELKIPKLVISNKKIENILNKKFESDIMNFYNLSVKEAETYFDDFPEVENKFVVSSDYDVKKNNNKVLSMLIKYYKYSGGAHGIYEYVPYNIDLSSGEIFILKDIFNENSNYKQILEDEIKRQIIELNKEQNLPYNSTQLYDFNNIKDNQKFYIKDDNIVLFFDLYEIAPYVAGIPEFTIDKGIINDLLRDKYKEIL